MGVIVPAILEAREHASKIGVGHGGRVIVFGSEGGTNGHPSCRSHVGSKNVGRIFRGTSRASFEAAAATSLLRSDGGAPSAKQFERANAWLDMTSRQLAAAYHAPDATDGNKIDALHQAASMILAWSRKLDELGLARAPASYRADPSIALTFEDVASGPAKRWRSEGAAPARHCVESARASHIESQAARECRTMLATYARVLAHPRDAGAAPPATACACDPGDPL
ncbi:MAG: hypothetical protein K0S65_3706, partial [Labilithrix sp.]|nr:hypothetical protein [Labilithrix sp.]